MSAQSVFDDLSAELVKAGAVEGRLFSVRALLLGNKVFACEQGDRIAFKLGAGTPEYTQALALPGAEPWQAVGKRRPYKDWISVRIEENSELEDTDLGSVGQAAMRFMATTLA